jgi:hypothetical protein
MIAPGAATGGNEPYFNNAADSPTVSLDVMKEARRLWFVQ